jgi:transcriptional regulator with XRE-family HTH domain
MKAFTAKQLHAIELLALGKSQAKICDAVGITPQTLANWKHIPGFVESAQTRAKEIIREANASLYSGLSAALPDYLEILDEIIRDKKRTNNAVRLRAIALALQNQLSLRGLDVDAEIQELKEIIGDRKDETE